MNFECLCHNPQTPKAVRYSHSHSHTFILTLCLQDSTLQSKQRELWGQTVLGLNPNYNPCELCEFEHIVLFFQSLVSSSVKWGFQHLPIRVVATTGNYLYNTGKK